MIQESARTGIVQKDKETVALIPEIKFGMLTPEDLEKLAAVSRKYEIPAIKITSAQRPMMMKSSFFAMSHSKSV